MIAEAGGIRPLRRDLLERATETLARAFARDPMFTWMFPEPQHRARALLSLNRVPLE